MLDFIGLQFTWGILAAGLLIVLARVVDVSLATVRTISVVNGRTKVAFICAFAESIIWITVISAVVPQVQEQPVLAVFFALGFALGNVVGIRAEQFLALGFLVLRVVSRDNWQPLADTLRNAGYGVTTFIGQGVSGPVGELSVICRRRDFAKVVAIVQDIDPGAFYYTEMAGAVNRSCRPYIYVPGVRK